jgi:hypothetical protein
MFQKSKPRSPKAKPSTNLPAWATKTEDEIAYCLQMEDSGGEHLEAIYDLTRAEYIALKAHLARMRGLKVAA